MVKVDYDLIRGDVAQWSNDKLISEATVNIANYNPEVQKILRDELSSRNINTEVVENVQVETKQKNENQEFLKYHGVKGWLLVFVVFTFLFFLSASIDLLKNLSASQQDFVEIITNIVFVGGALFINTMILLKKKSIRKVLMVLMVVFALITGLGAIYFVTTKYYLGVAGGIVSTLINLLWFEYFRKSKRVIHTLIK